MTQTFGKTVSNSERGVALLIAIFTLMLLTAIGFGLIVMTNTDTSISSNFRDEQTAFFSAKAGMEEARDRMRSSATNSLANPNVLPTVLPGNAGAFLYILNPLNGEADTPWVTNGNAYPDDEVCNEMTTMGNACAGNPPVPPGGGWYATTTKSNAYATNPVMAWKWTRINLKTNMTSSGSTQQNTVDGNAGDTNERVCWTGAQEITTNLATCQQVNANYQPVYVLTTLAVTPSGSRRMVQAEASATTFPSLPGPLIFDGSNPTFNAPSSNVFAVNGNDQSGPGNAKGPGATCPAGQPSQYALGAFGGSPGPPATGAVNALETDANKRPNSYTGTGNPTGTTGTASSGDVSGALQTLATVGGLEALVSEVTLVAGNFGNVYPGNPAGGIANPGTVSPYNPQVNVVQGDLTLPGGWSGAGILLVQGNLTLSGNVNYNGLILVIGKGTMTKNGGGNGTLDGSMLVANLYDSHGNPLPTTSAPGAPSVTWNGGGNATFQYDSCWSSALSNTLAYRIVAVREMIK